MLQFGASLTDDNSSVNYDRNMFIIQATDDHNIFIIYAPRVVNFAPRNIYSTGVTDDSLFFKVQRLYF